MNETADVQSNKIYEVFIQEGQNGNKTIKLKVTIFFRTCI